MPTQKHWRQCSKCQGLFYSGNSWGKCPAGDSHDLRGSNNYVLVQNDNAAVGQDNWRWYNKCEGLFFAGNSTLGTCPGGGTHDTYGSGNYVLVQNNIDHPGEQGWNWCHKCEGLFFGNNITQSVCPAGGNHENYGSGNYSLPLEYVETFDGIFKGGGAYGVAYLGALEYLHRNDRWFSRAAGNSAGSIIAGLIAAGLKPLCESDGHDCNEDGHMNCLKGIMNSIDFTEIAHSLPMDQDLDRILVL